MQYLTKPYPGEELKEILHPFVKEWFFNTYPSFSKTQLYGVMEVHLKNNILISAATGGTKTLTAFLSIINELVNLADKGKLKNQVYAVYISPLKALSNDISVNLEKPLKEIKEIAKKHGKELDIRVGLRTGDTTPTEKQKMLKKPPHILVTTPESLALMLASFKFVDLLKDVNWAIIDEIHSLAENKRGVHLSLSLERLQNLSPYLARIGLSATVAPIEEIAKYLVGDRECKIAQVDLIKKFDLEVMSPVEDLMNITEAKLQHELYSLMDKLIQEHKTTLIFTNTRAGTERVVHHLKEKFPKNYTENIGAHHGSLSKKHRLEIENNLRAGKLKAVVCLEGNTEILDSDGNWIKIKDINKTKVKSLNKNLKLNDNRIITKITKENKDKLIKITTNFGKEIISTREHKFLTINSKGDLSWKEARNINKNDYVGTIRKYNHKIYTKKELDLLTLANYPDNGYLEVKERFLNQIKNKILSKHKDLKSYWSKKLKRKLAYSTFLHDLRGEYLLKVGIIKDIISDLKIKKSNLWKSIIHYSSSKLKAKRLEINEDLTRLLGFMSAEGYISDRALYASNKDKKLLNYYGKLIKKLSGKNPFIKKNSSGTSILVWDSIFLSKFLQNLGFKKGRKSRINSIPKFMFRLDSKLLFSFISGYLDGDGFPETKMDGRTYALGFCTTSKQITEDLMKLLLREGIVSSIRSRYINKKCQILNGRLIRKKGWFYEVVVIGGDHLRTFIKNITPKRNNLIKAKRSLFLDGHSNRDIIPNLGKKLKEIRNKLNLSSYKMQKIGLNPIKYELNQRCISRKQLGRLLSIYKKKDRYLKDLANSEIFWEKIKSKTNVKKERFVYNIEVKKDHNYVANGFITKNCSTSLELGIDIGYIDLVICLGSPKSVARATQRIGRSGHSLHETVKGKLIVLDRDDLIECSVLLKNAIEKKIDKIHIPTNCLDVLAQQIHGMAVSDIWKEEDMFNLIKKSYCYKDLKKEDFLEVVHYLAGHFASLEERYIYAKIWYDEENHTIGKKGKLSRVIHMTNIGTIPDETSVKVKIGEVVIGTIDEAFLEKLKPRDIFVLGGSTYEYKFARGMTAQVIPAIGKKPTVPSWFSEMLPLSFDLAKEIGRFRRLIEDHFVNKATKKDILKFINNHLYVDDKAANAIYEYMREQYLYAILPTDKRLLIEYYNDENENKKYVVFHSLYGRRVNDVLSRAVGFAISKLQKRDVEIGISDNGFYIASPNTMQATRALSLIKPEELRQVMDKAIDKTEVLKRRFRHCATRSLMILRQYKGNTKRVGRQQVSSMILLKAVKKLSENFCILKEARREVLEDLMDIENAKKIIQEIKDGKLKIEQINTTLPSPFAFNLVLQGYTDIMKMEERIEFLKRMHNMVLAKIGKTHKIK